MAVVLTLGLGIGANAAVFGLVHAVVLSPLPYEDSDELYSILERHTSGRPRIPSYPTYQDWAQRADVFEGLAFARGAPLTYRAEGHSGLLLGAFVTEGFFEILGVPAELGRVLTADDHRPGAEGAVLLSSRAWQRWFGGDPGIVGRSLVVDELAFTVVGVMPASFAYPDWGADNDLWMPISRLPPAELAALNQRGFSADSRIVGRLRSDVALPAAQRSMNRVAEALAAAYPDVSAGWTTAQLESLKELEVRSVRPRLLMLWAGVLLVLLMCCLNLANLYLVQGSSRRREYSVRAALGAHPGRLFRQVASETLCLAVVGGALGVALAHRSMAWASSGGLTDLPRISELRLDGPVLLVAALLSVGSALLFALLSVRHVAAASLPDDVRGADGGGTVRTTRLLSGIQAVQIGMTFVLLLGAWLLGETLLKLARVDPGYDPRGLLVVPINPPSPSYDEEPAAVDLYSRLMRAVRAVPGVLSVGLTNHGPGGLAGAPTAMAVGGVPQDPEPDLSVLYRTVSPGYFGTLATPVVAGREFTEADLEGGEGPVIVNETLAARFGGAPPIGHAIGVRKAASSRADFGEPLMGLVVGVVADLDVSETGGRPIPVVYVPFTHSPWAQVRLLVRARDASAPTMRAVEDAIRSLEPALPLSGPFVGVRRLEDLRSVQRSQERLNAGLMGAFAAVAVLLACVGMYGVVSFTVVLRAREMGVRMALGAAPRQVAAGVVRQAAAIGAVGLVGGVVVAVALSSLITSLLFEVSPHAVERYATVAVTLLALAAGAAYVPARRASRLDPAMVLRSD